MFLQRNGVINISLSMLISANKGLTTRAILFNNSKSVILNQILVTWPQLSCYPAL